ncbi:MAG: tRNA pseudouridine(55) synthase TruB [Thermodesulfobacteriota bacterium]|nr:tRNA pseudouridine(55) synthase TruB [Thermodesulfobacteriota bacterium]
MKFGFEVPVNFKRYNACDMNGVLIIDKPSRRTSYDIIRDVKKLLGTKKVGHAGTLDPLATGVLTICINEGTKLSQFLANDDKQYRVTMLLGVRTDTLDTDGQVIERCEPCLQTEEITDVIRSFAGSIKQRAPRYSAVKFNGKPLYKWTRQGVDIEPPLRNVEIYQIEVEEVNIPHVIFSVSCSKGTYIRSLCADIGDRLGCGACVSDLRRTVSGSFSETDAISLETFADAKKTGGLEQYLVSMADALPAVPSILIDQDTADRIRTGYQPVHSVFTSENTPLLKEGDLVKFVTKDSVLIAVAKMFFSSENVSLLNNGEQATKTLRVFN